MQDLHENFYQTRLYLLKGEELESGMIQKVYCFYFKQRSQQFYY